MRAAAKHATLDCRPQRTRDAARMMLAAENLLFHTKFFWHHLLLPRGPMRDWDALGRHGAALGGGDECRDFLQPIGLLLRQAAGAKPKRGDQAAMHDQICIATDWRGEMRVAPQVEAEMADVLRRIFGLALRAQHH